MKILIIGGEGYIGSRLAWYLSDTTTHTVHIVDSNLFGHGYNFHVHHLMAQEAGCLDRRIIQTYDVIIYLAGHSSVLMCQNEPHAAFDNNVNQFLHVMKLMSPKQILIHASTSSLYSAKAASDPTDALSLGFVPITMYDLSMYTRELLAAYARDEGKQIASLRFGTVCGFSKNWRTDIMINKMINTAVDTGQINIFAPETERPILGLSDLCRLIRRMLQTRYLKKVSGIFNVSSFQSTVHDIGSAVAKQTGAKIISTQGTSHYTFSMSNKLTADIFDFEFVDTAESIAKEIMDHMPKIQNAGIRA